MTQVVSSISGLEIYSPSAGYAPTNSGDVSAIASAYQVVSATATQLYAGTAYVTSVNGDALSAARAGNAANASLATSAWYDGTGRLISALPDSAAVSSIASSYAESAVSSKADASSLSSYALSADVSGVIDTVSSNSASWSGGSLPITGSAGDESATYAVTGIEYIRNDTAGEPDKRTAYYKPDYMSLDYTVDDVDYYNMLLTESRLEFSDPTGYHTVDAYSIDNWNSAVDTVANNSATWGQGGVDSATVSAIASSYAESAVSSKLDSSASSSFYTTGNESGFVDSAYVDSAVSSKADSSALSSYALSADVSGTVDLVSSQSANWGGSALALSAGPGVKLEKSGNVLLVQADETLLWSGANTSAATLSEPYSNFERIGVVLGFPTQGKTYHVFEAASATQLMYSFGQTNAYLCAIKCGITDGTAFNVNDAKYVWTPYGTSTQVATDTGNVASAKNCLVKIYGINRTATNSPDPEEDDPDLPINYGDENG